MSHTHPTSASSSNFQFIFDNALKAYQRRTKENLLAHPLVAQLQDCNSPSRILDVLRQEVQDLNQSISRRERRTRWLDPTVKVFHRMPQLMNLSEILHYSELKAADFLHTRDCGSSLIWPCFFFKNIQSTVSHYPRLKAAYGFMNAKCGLEGYNP